MYRRRLLRDIFVAESQTPGSTASAYRERSFDETKSDDENEEESGISGEDDGSSKKEYSSSRGTGDNDEDEKEQLTTRIRRVVIETRTNTELDHQTIKIKEYRTEFMTSLAEVSITNVIILKAVHLDLFSERSIKTRIFI